MSFGTSMFTQISSACMININISTYMHMHAHIYKSNLICSSLSLLHECMHAGIQTENEHAYIHANAYIPVRKAEVLPCECKT